MQSDEKECPYCGETIKIIAKKCKWCGEWLDENSNHSIVDSNMSDNRPLETQLCEQQHIEKCIEDCDKSNDFISGVDSRDIPVEDCPTRVVASSLPLSYNLYLVDSGKAKLAVVKLVHEISGLGIKESKELIDAAPCCVLSALDRQTAEELKLDFEEIGAVAKLEESYDKEVVPFVRKFSESDNDSISNNNENNNAGKSVGEIIGSGVDTMVGIYDTLRIIGVIALISFGIVKACS